LQIIRRNDRKNSRKRHGTNELKILLQKIRKINEKRKQDKIERGGKKREKRAWKSNLNGHMKKQ